MTLLLILTLVEALLAITTFGGVLVDVFGFTSNVGNVFYAGVLAAQHLIIQRFGHKRGLNCILIVFASLVMWFLLGQALRIVGGDSLPAAYTVMIDSSRRFVWASFIAFWCGQLMFIAFYRDKQPSWRQDVKLWEAMLTGYAIKVALGLATLPLLSRARA